MALLRVLGGLHYAKAQVRISRKSVIRLSLLVQHRARAIVAAGGQMPPEVETWAPGITALR